MVGSGRLVVVPFLFLRYMASPGAQGAEHRVTGLAKHQLLGQHGGVGDETHHAPGQNSI